jgi:hypothetical protein
MVVVSIVPDELWMKLFAIVLHYTAEKELRYYG